MPKVVILRSALMDKGYRVSITHVDPESIKTDAPASVVWDMFRSYVQQNPETRPLDKLPKDCPAYKILSVPPKEKFNFAIREDAKVASKGIPRFLPNPST